MDRIYGSLIENIPDELQVEDFTVGARWTFVRAGGATGLSRTVNQSRISAAVQPRTNMPLKELARAVTSWNYISAGLGLAAINAAYNSMEYIETAGVTYGKCDYVNLMEDMVGLICDKRAAFVEYPIVLENGKDVCALTSDCAIVKCSVSSLINISPVGNAYPSSAAEFLLREQDCVFISGDNIIYRAC